ncbi:MAG: hypothetical protein HY698_10250 [Deltaproteobacteria bacterium]|nr:hypothetical protein [Deltaproteobacteria bacterium]
MRPFSKKGFGIDQLTLEVKIIYFAFCLFSLAALVFSILLYEDMLGVSTAGVREYYAGVPAQSAKSDSISTDKGPASSEGPDIELPDEVAVAKDMDAPPSMILPMTRRKLLEVTHFHLFTVPVFLLIIAHIFLLCRVSPFLKYLVVLSGLLSSMVHLGAPWVISQAGSAWAWLMPTSGAWLLLSALVMCGVPMIAMWRRPR